MKTMKVLTTLIIVLITLVSMSEAQSTSSIVPDLVGLNVPQAGAALHREGLRLGLQTLDLGTPVELDQLGTITVQSVAAGEMLAPGQAVDITIVRVPNIRFIYDDNDLTLINQTRRVIPLVPLSLVGQSLASPVLAGERWDISFIPIGGCVQIWSIGRAAPKAIDGCEEISAWFSTSDPNSYVWTQVAEVESFTITYSDVSLSACPAAPAASQDAPTVCDAYLPSYPSLEQARFLYLVYTYGAFSARNPTLDAWMPLSAPIITHADGTLMSLSDPLTYTDIKSVAMPLDGQVLTPLAPNECIVFRALDDAGALAPEPCGLIVADATLDNAFWRSDFTVTDSTGVSRTCAAAVDGELTVCVMQQ